MKSRLLMVALVAVMLMGVRTYAHDCGPCSEVGPCDSSCTKSTDLFSGLKRLVASNPCAPSECTPCDAVVACTPCDAIACDPCGACDDFGCNDGCGKKFVFGSRLKALFASTGCNPCDPCGPGYDGGCSPCADVCGPCDDVCGPYDAGCGPRFSFKKIFKGFGKLNCGCNNACGPCDSACGACDASNACDPCGIGNACDPCGIGNACDPCGIGNACDPCGAYDSDCGPCDACGSGKKFGQLLDNPRRNIKKFFDGFRFAKNACGPCDPCGAGACDPCGACNPYANCGPCDTVCGSPCSSLNANGNGEAAAPSQLPE